jgi:hypothetical protein
MKQSKKILRDLAKRQKAWDEMPAQFKQGTKRPGSKSGGK